MKLKHLAAALLATGFSLGAAQAQIKIGVVSSSTGPVAMVGIPQKNTVALLPTKVGDQTIRYIQIDDGSDPTASVVGVKKLLSEEKVDAIIGPSGSPNAMGVIQFIAEAKVPLLAPVGTAAVVLPMSEQKKWVFKTTANDDVIASALFEHMAKNGVKRLAYVGTADPYGENWSKVVAESAAKAGIQIVASESFQRQDTSVNAQALKVLAARPDAVLIAAPGTPALLPQLALVDRGYKGRFYQTHGAALPEFLKLGGKKVEGTLISASLMLVVDKVAGNHPSKKIAKQYLAAYEKAYNTTPATFGANVYDAGLLLEKAIPAALAKGKPGTVEFRSALRDALEQTKELAATQGVYNMSATDHSGFDERGRMLITVRDGKWTLATK